MRVSRCKMTFYRSLSALLVPVCWVVLSVAEDANPPGITAALGPDVTNSSGLNSTNSSGKGPLSGRDVDSSMIRRAFYVLVGLTIIGVLYFLIRAVRLRKPAHKKKYGLLSSYDDTVEMEAVDSEEDETVYEARSLRR